MLLGLALGLTNSAPTARSTQFVMPPGGFPICHPLPPQAEVPDSLAAWAKGARLFDGLGDLHRAAGTNSREAQRYFNQGLAWAYGFNHDEATRSFARAATLDPNCALCFWGVALAIGPNYNFPLMSSSRGRVAYAAIARARALAPAASPVSEALIGALEKRYPTEAAIGDSNYDQLQRAYAAAMHDVARQFPADDDVQVLTAEADMGLHAWRLWSLDGKPAPGTDDIEARLETVMARNPRHAGANHYYIHVMEASPDPGRAEAAADRLGALMPGAGHIVHMPAHIYQRIGRYEDVAAVNDRAARADLAYFGQTAPLDYYAGYTSHNWEFEAFGAAEIGRTAEALAALGHARALISDAELKRQASDGWNTGRIYTFRVRFGEWAQLISMPAPSRDLPGLYGAWLWSRGYALAATGRIAEAAAARADLASHAAAAKPDATIGFNKGADIYAVALKLLDARLAEARHDEKARLALLRDAVAAEDRLAYDEPCDWNVPARPLLGRALLENGRYTEAETIYREDLRRRPQNGWSLLGLSQAQKAAGQDVASHETAQRFAGIWKTADIRITASSF
jgi:tetratricopeptide (TPR) repeat protein